MIYSTIRTNSTLKNKVIASIMPGEHIRVWEEQNRFLGSPYPLYRIYAETLENSITTALLQNSSNYQQITKEELEDSVGGTEAAILWEEYEFSKRSPEKPSLIIISGYPLSGKSTLSRQLMKSCPENTIHVESDNIRDFIAKYTGYGAPKYTYTESLRTFNTANEIIRMGLSKSVNVIFDATNLQERGRFGAYLAAKEYAAPVAVIFVEASDEVMRARLKVAIPSRRLAYEQMSQTKFTKVQENALFLKVDSSLDPKQMLVSIQDKLPIRLCMS